jgi:signal transduction histidine kinase
VTQTARRVARGAGRAAGGGPTGQAARAARRQALAGKAASWYAALPVRGREVVQDTALALALAVLNLLSLVAYQRYLHPLWLAFFLVSAQCLPLALRRVWPLPVAIGVGVLRDLYDGLSYGFAPLPLAPAIAVATVAERSRPWIRWLTVVGTIIGLTYSQTLPGHIEPYDWIVQAFIMAAAWAIGTLSRRRRAALADAAARADRAEASLDLAAPRAAAAERLRLARELHDVVAHHVSLMAVQAEAVGALLPARPAEASRSADLIAVTARQAMTELRRLLGVLRLNSSDQNPSSERTVLTPAPSLSRLHELIDVMRGAGLAVSLTAGSGPPPSPGADVTRYGIVQEALTPSSRPPLSPGVDLTAYRIVQEALTNALRHAPGAAAAVTVAYEDDCLTVEVTNTARRIAASARPAWPAPDLGGYGLAGIAERVASCGGSLSLGPGRDGSFTVTARLPLT